jgi:hypothetical protein
MNAQAWRSPDDPSRRLSARAMAGRTRQSTRSGPPAIAIRNDGDVKTRSLGDGRLRGENLLYGQLLHEHALSPPRRK